MSYAKVKNREALLDEIIKSPNEYSVNQNQNWNSKKSDILKILKTHFPIKIADYQLGLSQNLNEKHRLIAFEFDDKTFVREYNFSSNCCCECQATKCINKYGIIFVKNQHECKRREYFAVMKNQEKLKIRKYQKFVSNLKAAEASRRLPPSKDRIEKLFNKMIKSMKEYTDENHDVRSKKREIITLLKTHRPIKIGDYHFSTSNGGESIFVFDEKDRTKSYEYSKQNASDAKKGFKWPPSNECSKKKCSPLILKFGIVFAPIYHNCQLKAVTTVNEIQNTESPHDVIDYSNIPALDGPFFDENQNDEIVTSVLAEADSESSTDKNDVNFDTEINIQVNESSNLLSSNLNDNSENVAPLDSVDLKRKNIVEDDDDEDCVLIEVKPPCPKRPKIENISTSEQTSISLTQGDCVTIDKKPEILSKMEYFEKPFEFERPSTSTLKEICKKLNIIYNKEAYKLWANIEFEQISHVSKNLKLHNFKTKNIFECFSLLFTGATDEYYKIQHIINQTFQDKILNSCKMTQREIDRMFMTSTISSEHLTFITEFLNCRIAIFEESYLSRYGKWDSETTVLTLVFSYFNGVYSIVLNL